jgi:hypothetical protein
LGYPLYELVKPGQPAPFNSYPFIALGIVIVAAAYAMIVSVRDPHMAERIGSVMAESHEG